MELIIKEIEKLFAENNSKDFVRKAHEVIENYNTSLGKITPTNFFCMDGEVFTKAVHPDPLIKQIKVYFFEGSLMCKFPKEEFSPSGYNPYDNSVSLVDRHW